VIIQRPDKEIRKQDGLVDFEILAALAGLLGGWVKRELSRLEDSVELEGRNL